MVHAEVDNTVMHMSFLPKRDVLLTCDLMHWTFSVKVHADMTSLRFRSKQ